MRETKPSAICLKRNNPKHDKLRPLGTGPLSLDLRATFLSSLLRSSFELSKLSTPGFTQTHHPSIYHPHPLRITGCHLEFYFCVGNKGDENRSVLFCMLQYNHKATLMQFVWLWNNLYKTVWMDFKLYVPFTILINVYVLKIFLWEMSDLLIAYFKSKSYKFLNKYSSSEIIL